MTTYENDVDRWLKSDATDEDLGQMPDKTRTSILHSREIAGWKYLAMATTIDGYGDYDIHVLPHRVSSDPEQPDLVPIPGAATAVVIPIPADAIDGDDATYDRLLAEHGWERAGDWSVADFGGIVQVQRARFVGKGGRPAIGQEVKARMTDEMVAEVEAYAEDHAIGRPEAIRILVACGLAKVKAERVV